MRKTITLGTAGIAGVVTAGLLALPIASAVTGDDERVKRDEDAPEVALVEEDDGDDDSVDPASRVTRDHTANPRSRDGQTRDAAAGATATGGTGHAATGGDLAATGDVSGGGDGSGDDVSDATGD